MRNAELADTLGEVLHRPTVLPVPAFGPKLLLGGERADALLFEGQRVLPRRLLADGYEFAHPTLEGALRSMLGALTAERPARSARRDPRPPLDLGGQVEGAIADVAQCSAGTCHMTSNSMPSGSLA